MIKLCKNCGNKFETKIDKAKFCCYQCYWNWLKGRKIKIKNVTCIYCNKKFTINNHLQRKFCSQRCSWDSMKNKKFTRKERIVKRCLKCKKEFKILPCYKNRKYCSLKCSSKKGAWNKGKKCPQISKGLTGKKATLLHRINSSKAHTKNNFGNLIKVFRNNITYKKWRQEVFKRDNYTCQECKKRGGYLEAHHIKKFRIILKEMEIKLKRQLKLEDLILSEELSNIKNGQTLCKRCHNLTKDKKGL